MNHFTHSGSLHEEPSIREIAHAKLARRAAAEGIVLLKNEGILPLAESASIAILGCGADKTVKGGIGSGDVNNRRNISIYEGMKAAGAKIVSKDWIADYQKRYDDARETWKEKILEDAKHVDNVFDAYAKNPFSFPEGRAVDENDISDATVAVYVISRISGEGKDRRRAKGDYYLSEREQEDILYLNHKNLPLILILNSGGPVELTDILEEASNIKAILTISQPGQEGGHAVADVLFGKTSPGGRLTSTWARRYEDYPYSEAYSYLNGNLEKEEYKEGIYVGYRYFDSIGIEPLFTFGYGLSYTTFTTEYKDLRITEQGFEVSVVVQNSGEMYEARDVVQVYMTPPQNGNAKEYQRLIGFAKTSLLRPKEIETLTIEVEQKQIAGFSEEKHGWIIEKGFYGIWVGENARTSKLIAVLHVPENVLIEENQAVCPKKAEFEDLGAVEHAKNLYKQWISLAEEDDIPFFLYTPKREERKSFHSPIAKEKTVEELIPLLYGNITQGASTLGSAGIRVPGSAGETSEALEEKYGKRSLIMADGPAGLRLRQRYDVDRKTDTVYRVGVLGALENGCLEEAVQYEGADTYYQYCTAFPVGTALAQTWDLELMEKFGRAIACEMEEFHVDLWLAPGMNIQRNPLCGRNFEYYSEDPFLSGVLAAAVTRGVQSNGNSGVTIKHFACNNQEDNRMGVDACVSERALREIYFRGFEIAVKKSAPVSIMTSYNLINGVHAANSRDLCTVVVREEWGFEGTIMSDWNTTVPEDGSEPWKCAAAGNDIIMPGYTNDDADIRDAYEKGLLSEREIRSCAGRIIAMIDKLAK